MTMYHISTGSKFHHGPRFTKQQRNLIINGYEKMKTLPAILQDFRTVFPDRGISVTENSIRSLLDRARKADMIKRQKYSRGVPIDIKMQCIALYNDGKSQRDIIAGLKEKFPGFKRKITRNMISGWVKWGKDHKLLTRIKSRRDIEYRVKRAEKEKKPRRRDDWVAPITLPYVRCIDPKRAPEIAQLLRMPVEVYRARQQRWYTAQR